MPSLKDLKNRIKSVRNTQKITKAMKMVAAAKLRRAREAAEAARPYGEALESMLQSLAVGYVGNDTPLLSGTGRNDTQLLIIATSDRGLCGAFNGSIVRASRKRIRELQAEGKKVKLLFVGRKGYEALRAEFSNIMLDHLSDIGRKKLVYSDAEGVAKQIMDRFAAGEFDSAHIVYNRFQSAIAQIVTWQQIVPLAVVAVEEKATSSTESRYPAPYDYEPSEEELLANMLPRNVGMQVYKALLENAASEQGARMTAMDNATRNAGDMIKKLNLKYNRTRQAAITKELIEIISGAEAV